MLGLRSAGGGAASIGEGLREVLATDGDPDPTRTLPQVIATQAVSHGKLTIMRSTADETEEGRKAARAFNS